MDNWINFIIMSLLILIAPGPSFFAVIKNSAHGGIKSGIFTTFGIANAHLIYATLVTLGIIFIFVSSQTVFLIIKILGAAYIIFLGLKNILMPINLNIILWKSRKQQMRIYSNHINKDL